MKELIGTGVALITPFTKQGIVDTASLTRIVNFQIDNGVNYLVVLGTTAESAVLSREEKQLVIDTIVSANAGRLPLVLGIGGNNTKAVVDEFVATDMTVFTAILSVSPMYNKPSQEGIYRHFAAIAAVSSKPIILYNVPGRTGRNMTAATSLRLAAHPNIAGIKEAGPDLSQTIDLLKDRPKDFLVVSGDDEIVMAQIACGMDGVISVAANAFPKPFSDMIRYSMAGDFSMAKRLNDLMVEGYSYMYEENNPAGIKAYLYEQGVIENVLRLPLVPASEPLQAKIHKYLQKFAD